MADSNHIDDLFRDKLAGGTVGGSSAAAWSGAEALLSQHYKALFWKQFAAMVFPVLLIAGTTWIVWPGEEVATQTPASLHVNEQTDIEVNPSQTTTNIASPYSDPVVASSPVQTEDEVKKTEHLSEKSTPVNHATSSEYTEETLTTSIVVTRDSEVNSGFDAIQADNRPATAKALTREPSNVPTSSASASELKSFTLMPTFSVNGLGAGQLQDLASREPLKKEQPELDVPRFEVRTGAGLLGATSLDQSAINRSGYHLTIEMIYHFKGRLYGSVSAIYHERFAQVQAAVRTPQFENLVLHSIGYIDIPVQVGYRLAARHNLSFGMSFSPLARVSESNGTLGEGAYAIDDAIGHRSGLANFDAAGIVGYQFQISSRFFATAQLRYGLFDVTDDDFYLTGEKNEHNHQFRLGFNYRLFSR